MSDRLKGSKVPTVLKKFQFLLQRHVAADHYDVTAKYVYKLSALSFSLFSR